MIAIVFLPLLDCDLDIFPTGKRVKHGGEYRENTAKIPANIYLCGPEKVTG